MTLVNRQRQTDSLILFLEPERLTLSAQDEILGTRFDAIQLTLKGSVIFQSQSRVHPMGSRRAAGLNAPFRGDLWIRPQVPGFHPGLVETALQAGRRLLEYEFDEMRKKRVLV